MIILAIALLIGATSFSAASVEPEWVEVTKKDLTAIHEIILEVHPGTIDPRNPEFQIKEKKLYFDALKRGEEAKTFQAYQAVLNSYLAGFNDGHFHLTASKINSLDIDWAGFTVGYVDGDVKVMEREAEWPVPLPPLGAKVLTCDGIEPADAMSQRVFPFHLGLPTVEASWIELTPFLFVDEGNPWAPPFKKCVVEVEGKKEAFDLVWKGTPRGEWDKRIAFSRFSPKGSYSIKPFGMKGLLVTIPSFRPRSPEERKALEKIVDHLRREKSCRFVVFDLQGNRGGTLFWVMELLYALYGEDYVKYKLSSVTPPVKALFRISDSSIRYLRERLTEKEPIYGSDSQVVENIRKQLKRMQQARDLGEEWLVQGVYGSEVPPHSSPPKASFRGLVFYVTDGGCGSSCLRFCDLLRLLPDPV